MGSINTWYIYTENIQMWILAIYFCNMDILDTGCLGKTTKNWGKIYITKNLLFKHFKLQFCDIKYFLIVTQSILKYIFDWG